MLTSLDTLLDGACRFHTSAFLSLPPTPQAPAWLRPPDLQSDAASSLPRSPPVRQGCTPPPDTASWTCSATLQCLCPECFLPLYRPNTHPPNLVPRVMARGSPAASASRAGPSFSAPAVPIPCLSPSQGSHIGYKAVSSSLIQQPELLQESEGHTLTPLPYLLSCFVFSLVLVPSDPNTHGPHLSISLSPLEYTLYEGRSFCLPRTGTGT